MVYHKKKTIVFDFDGVIHSGYRGYGDGSIYGKIDLDLLDYIKELMKNYYIVISSNRPAEQIVNYMNDLNYGIEFKVFNKDMGENMYWNDSDAIGVTNQKAVGYLYVDDRGFRYENLEDLKITMINMNIPLKQIGCCLVRLLLG